MRQQRCLYRAPFVHTPTLDEDLGIIRVGTVNFFVVDLAGFEPATSQRGH